ncbi:MAG: sulfate adenylyltransferase subunit CysN [Phycisphaerae bacterium]|nr:sulfate adenylyltransferase subunit CysN [Phycisphaerae bacterium]
MTAPFEQGENVEEYLARYERNELLRFLTCGNVDDGKSTLIGRLLHDTGRIYEDHMQALERDSRVHGTTGGGLDLALVVDGLKAEREQGITIDVAWRYFATARRSFIIADCPGHEQYTRNMATGASHCQLAISLIDARHGVTTQTRRHAFIASLLGIRHVVAAVNKMDLVGWSEERFRAIESEFLAFCQKLGVADPVAVPVSARDGDNVVDRSDKSPWYSGGPIMELLETVPVDARSVDGAFRLPVQYVIRPSLDFRGFAGRIANGSVRPGDRVKVLPSGKETRVRRIARAPEDGGDAPLATSGESVVLVLEDEVDCSRGDVIVGAGTSPTVTRRIESDVVWMQDQPLVPGQQFLLGTGAKRIPCTVRRVRWTVDVNTLETCPADTLRLNEIGRIEIECDEPVVVDGYRQCHGTGAIILVDRASNATSGAGMVRLPTEAGARRAHWETRALESLEQPGERPSLVTLEERARRWRQNPGTVLIYGPPKSGKTRAAQALERTLFDAGHAVVMLDGQAIRRGMSKDLAFTDEDRSENLRRAAEMAKLLNEQGYIVILAMVAPQDEARQRAAALIGKERFLAMTPDEQGRVDTDAVLQAFVGANAERPAPVR